MKALIPAIAVLSIATAAITLQPSRQDFGQAAVNGLVVKTFQVSLPTGAGPADTMNVSVTGANAADFDVTRADPSNTCRPSLGSGWRGWRSGACVLHVDFKPKSIGIKTATLVVSDSRGNRGTAALIGKGVAAICEMKVVFCNYAHLYSGVFKWNSVLRGPRSSTTIAVQVDVVNGVASCNGSETIFDAATDPQTQRGDIQGKGLIAVEFEVDDTNRQVYNIRAACPSPSGLGSPVRPAELGDYEQQSYPQEATSGVGMDLVGANSFQDGAADPINGVDGTVTVSWALRR